MENVCHFNPGERRRKRGHPVQREGRFRNMFKASSQRGACETTKSRKADGQKNVPSRAICHVGQSTSPAIAKSTARSLTLCHGRSATGNSAVETDSEETLSRHCSHRGSSRDFILQPCAFCTPGLSIDCLDIEILDPFQTHPVRFAPALVNWCDTYCLSILWPGLIPTSLRAKEKNKVIWSWLQLSRHDDALFTHFLFCAIFHHRFLRSFSSHQDRQRITPQQTQDVITDTRTNQILSHLYLQCIKRVSEAVRHSSRASSDAIILSVGCLINDIEDDPLVSNRNRTSPFHPPLQSLQWLDVYGYLPLNPVHWNGLVKLITIKGGLEQTRLPALAALISYLDILTASKILSHPRFPFAALAEDDDLLVPENDNIVDTATGTRFALLFQVGFTPEMVEVFQAAGKYTFLLATYKANPDIALDLCSLSNQRNMIQHGLLSLPSSEECDHIQFFRQCYPVYEACRLAGLIFGVGVIFPLPSNMTVFPSLVQMLQIELLREHSFESRWCIPEVVKILVWTLVLGGIAASGLPERSWFVSELFRVGLHAELSTWEDVKVILHEILWLDSACDTAGRQLWSEVTSPF